MFKFTTNDIKTFCDFKWTPGQLYHISNPNGVFCTSGVFHAYTDLTIAAFFRQTEVPYKTARLWRASGDVIVSSLFKVGCSSMALVEELPLPPEFSVEERAAVALGIEKEPSEDDDDVGYTFLRYAVYRNLNLYRNNPLDKSSIVNEMIMCLLASTPGITLERFHNAVRKYTNYYGNS